MSQKREFIQSMKFFMTILLIYFFFFGYICNSFDKQPGNYLLYVYLNFGNVISWPTILILFVILVIHAFSEDFLIYGIKYNLWTVPVVIILSWVWYAINYRLYFEPIVLYFSSFHWLLNIIVLLVIAFVAGLIGGYFKSQFIIFNRSKFKEQHQK